MEKIVNHLLGCSKLKVKLRKEILVHYLKIVTKGFEYLLSAILFVFCKMLVNVFDIKYTVRCNK